MGSKPRAICRCEETREEMECDAPAHIVQAGTRFLLYPQVIIDGPSHVVVRDSDARISLETINASGWELHRGWLWRPRNLPPPPAEDAQAAERVLRPAPAGAAI